MNKQMNLMTTRSLLAQLSCVLLVAILSALATAQARPKSTLNHRNLPVNIPFARAASASWVSPRVQTTEDQLVYVTYVLSLTSGGTNIYDIAPGGPQLVGMLDVGGGGPVAVDSQENVYVIQTNLDGNLYQLDAAVYRYARGSTQGTKLFDAPNIGAEAMTVAADGTIYIAGQVPESINFAVAKFSPPSYKGQVISVGPDVAYPTGISLDPNGNLFVGWLVSDNNFPYGPCVSGCITELPAGQSKWQIRLPDLAANSIGAGPVVTTDDTLLFWADNAGRYNYIETVPSGRHYPTKVNQLSPNLFPNAGNPSLALNGDGSEFWMTVTGLGGPLGTNVEGVNYPGGDVATSFIVDSPADLIFIMGIGVSPSYLP
jgi:hypothetical protein